MTEGNTPAAAGPPAHIWTAIAGVMADVTGLPKDRKMPKDAHVGEYAFRSAEAVDAAMARAFRDHKLMLQARDLHLEQAQTKVSTQGRDKVWTTVWLRVTYVFTSLVDGSTAEFASAGEGRSDDDKSTNKALTAAKKNALTQAFVVAYQQLDDTDGHHTVIDLPTPAPQPAPAAQETEPQRKAREDYERRRAGQSRVHADGYVDGQPQADWQASQVAAGHGPNTAPNTTPWGVDPEPHPEALAEANNQVRSASRRVVEAELKGQAFVPNAEQGRLVTQAAEAARHARRAKLVHIILWCAQQDLLVFPTGGTSLAAALGTALGMTPAGMS